MGSYPDPNRRLSSALSNNSISRWPFAADGPDMWQQQPLEPWPGSSNTASIPGGILGPYFAAHASPITGGILQGQVPDYSQSFSRDSNFAVPLDTFITPDYADNVDSGLAADGSNAPAPAAEGAGWSAYSTPPQPQSGPAPQPQAEPALFSRVAKRIAENFSEAFESPLGPSAEDLAAMAPLIRPTGAWTDAVGGPFRTLNAALFVDLPWLLDAANRTANATYHSAVDSAVEAAISAGGDRSTMERAGREIKALPEAFPFAAGLPRRIFPTPRAPVRVIGEEHHAISKPIFRALESHPNLSRYYQHRDPRFVTRAVDQAAHNGWWGWHKELDLGIAGWLREHPELTPDDFEDALRWRYSLPDLMERFPNGEWERRKWKR